MVRRHPHVFGGVTYESEEAQHKAWEEIKKAEKAGKEQYADYLPKAFEESKELIEKAKERKGYK
jgi:tetrapyrrole methylase family protein/MazG family protein